MSKSKPEDLSNLSMSELFRVEAENQVALLTNGLLELEKDRDSKDALEDLMRAAHSLKGAARIVNLTHGVNIAHALEDCFVAVQQERVKLRQEDVDLLFRGVDLLLQLSKNSGSHLTFWEQEHSAEISGFLGQLQLVSQPKHQPPPREDQETTPKPVVESAGANASFDFQPLTSDSSSGDGQSDTALLRRRKKEIAETRPQISTEGLNRLLGVASESVVESRWLQPFGASLLRLKRMQSEILGSLEALRDSMATQDLSEGTEHRFAELFLRVTECQKSLGERLTDLDTFDRRNASLSHRLYQEVLQSRMRPFADGVRRFPRMVRDLARSLGKEVRLEVEGESTQVDRELLARLEAPLAHLLRNSVDHGCEFPDERRQSGKSPEAVVSIEARHTTGSLQITVADDGPGLDVQRVREVIVEQQIAPPDVAQSLSEAELTEFLFLPGFSLKKTVTEISGRGVGLDVVRNMVRNVRGTIRAATTPGKGMRFTLQLPLTLSVVRALLFEVAGEPYAIPLSLIHRSLKISRGDLQQVDSRPHFQLGKQSVCLLPAHRILECEPPDELPDHMPVIVIGDGPSLFGLAVDRFRGEKELVLQPLDPRLGKVRDIAAAALMEDGSPVLMIDVEDMLRSVQRASSGNFLQSASPAPKRESRSGPKRVLVVDDSLTVRELERKLLSLRGFEVEVAVDGMDGWNAVRVGRFDLIIVDMDMPRMDGIELTSLIKNDPRFNSLPVMIISYKDRDEDRLRGLDACADYFLTKANVNDDTLVQAVVDLIGKPNE